MQLPKMIFIIGKMTVVETAGGETTFSQVCLHQEMQGKPQSNLGLGLASTDDTSR